MQGGRRASGVERHGQTMLRSGLLIVVLLGALAWTATLAAADGLRLTPGEYALLKEINRVRSERGLPPLSIDRSLERAARSHSADMLRTGSFAHGNFGRRLQRFRVRAALAGENLAWGNGDKARAEQLVAWWLASPPHRKNLLRASFRRVGVGAAIGVFLGYPDATVVTADFAG
jgi:hypothetical protein